VIRFCFKYSSEIDAQQLVRSDYHTGLEWHHFEATDESCNRFKARRKKDITNSQIAMLYKHFLSHLPDPTKSFLNYGTILVHVMHTRYSQSRNAIITHSWKHRRLSPALQLSTGVSCVRICNAGVPEALRVLGLWRNTRRTKRQLRQSVKASLYLWRLLICRCATKIL